MLRRSNRQWLDGMCGGKQVGGSMVGAGCELGGGRGGRGDGEMVRGRTWMAVGLEG